MINEKIYKITGMITFTSTPLLMICILILSGISIIFMGDITQNHQDLMEPEELGFIILFIEIAMVWSVIVFVTWFLNIIFEPKKEKN